MQLSDVTSYSLLFQLSSGFSPGILVLFLVHHSPSGLHYYSLSKASRVSVSDTIIFSLELPPVLFLLERHIFWPVSHHNPWQDSSCPIFRVTPCLVNLIQHGMEMCYFALLQQLKFSGWKCTRKQAIASKTSKFFQDNTPGLEPHYGRWWPPSHANPQHCRFGRVWGQPPGAGAQIVMLWGVLFINCLMWQPYISWSFFSTLVSLGTAISIKSAILLSFSTSTKAVTCSIQVLGAGEQNQDSVYAACRWCSNPAVDCHNFLLGPQLPSRLHRVSVFCLVPNYTAWWQWYLCKQLAYHLTYNLHIRSPQSLDHESDALTTTPSYNASAFLENV